jgi:hypothetical protein
MPKWRQQLVIIRSKKKTKRELSFLGIVSISCFLNVVFEVTVNLRVESSEKI